MTTWHTQLTTLSTGTSALSVLSTQAHTAVLYQSCLLFMGLRYYVDAPPDRDPILETKRRGEERADKSCEMPVRCVESHTPSSLHRPPDSRLPTDRADRWMFDWGGPGPWILHLSYARWHECHAARWRVSHEVVCRHQCVNMQNRYLQLPLPAAVPVTARNTM